jgi:geranylgeranyl diphosphate synthase type II
VSRVEAESLASYLDARRAEIESALDRYLPKRPACPPIIDDAMRYSLLAGGKRLRPVLTLASAESVAERHGTAPDAAREQALPASCALEMIHTYSLIHDDLPAMDNDSLRRGRATLHIVYNDGIAILAGDGLLTEAFALLAREPQHGAPQTARDAALAQRKLRAIQVIATAAGAVGMVGGQAIDLEAVAGTSSRPLLPRNGLEDMHQRKTGALIRAAAAAGAIMAGGSDDDIAAIDEYATHLGLAFQIVDDILDVSGASSELGKTAGKDAAAGKPTYPALYGLDESRRKADQSLSDARRALARVGLEHGRLAEIAAWVVRRTN